MPQNQYRHERPAPERVPAIKASMITMSVMTVLLLDARWPSMIPFNLVGKLEGQLRFTDEVPVKVRWNLDDIVRFATDDLLVSTNELDPQVIEAINNGASVIEVPSRHDALGQARDVMRRAVARGEWEQTQTHESLLEYLDEETEEFAQAVAHGTTDHIVSELGDVLLQVLFHAEIGARHGEFNLDDVAASFVSKMQQRSPYLFDGSDGVVPIEEQERLWEAGKHRSAHAQTN